MRLLRSVRNALEFMLFWLLSVPIALLPRRGVVGLARLLGDIGWRTASKSRRLAKANLDAAFGSSLSDSAKDIIVRTSFRTFALSMVDLCWFRLFCLRRIGKWVRIDPSMEYLSRMSPLIALTGHYGNWEILGQASAWRYGRMLSVAARLKNPFVSRAVNRMRSATGQVIVERDGALRRLLAELRGGGRVALLMDQNVLPEDGGEFVPFFGLPATISRAAAALMEHTGAAVIFCYCVADEDGRYTARAFPPMTVEDVRSIGTTATKWFASTMEKLIREAPGAWVWAYRRWKYIPDGVSREGYPYYAKPVPQGKRP